MSKKGGYILSIDQSTQGTKALLVDEEGRIARRASRAHRQIVSGRGWVSHDPEEIYRNTLRAVKDVLEPSGVPAERVVGVGISNQRETALIWDRTTGKPLADAVVWQCARAKEICEREEIAGMAEQILAKTGLKLSPYFPAAKLLWLLENVPGAEEKMRCGCLCLGTVDTWLVYKLTGGKAYKTDVSNASRTQLFHIHELTWDDELLRMFGVLPGLMAEVCDSDAHFGETDFDGLLSTPVPIHAAMGDSHAALFAQDCVAASDIKATYGTGSSIMMNTGGTAVRSAHGLVTSLAWKLGGKINYVLEGNVNDTGATITWLKDKAGMISSPGESEELCRRAVSDDGLYFVPAFSGLGAPYWDSGARGSLTGITRATGREEIVRAVTESIAYQIADVIRAMAEDAYTEAAALRVDGGPTRNRYLMQFQSDILNREIRVSSIEEMSALGAAYAAGIALGLYPADIARRIVRTTYSPGMAEPLREKKLAGWKRAVTGTLT